MKNNLDMNNKQFRARAASDAINLVISNFDINPKHLKVSKMEYSDNIKGNPCSPVRTIRIIEFYITLSCKNTRYFVRLEYQRTGYRQYALVDTFVDKSELTKMHPVKKSILIFNGVVIAGCAIAKYLMKK